jgi:hypothetical protein
MNAARQGGFEFWMFAIYDKDELDDLPKEDRKELAQMLKRETGRRSK